MEKRNWLLLGLLSATATCSAALGGSTEVYLSSPCMANSPHSRVHLGSLEATRPNLGEYGKTRSCKPLERLGLKIRLVMAEAS